MQSIKLLFPDFEEELLTELENTATHKFVKTEEVLIRSGQYLKSTMLVLDGSIKVYREDVEGGEFLMYNLHKGQACAISMKCAQRTEQSQVTAIATEDSNILVIPLESMAIWMSKYKSWYQFVINTYSTRIDELLLVIDQVAFRNLDERVSFYLRRQLPNDGSKTINISHLQIANDLNTSREVVSRLLKKMEQRDLIKLNRNSIELLNPLLLS